MSHNGINTSETIKNKCPIWLQNKIKHKTGFKDVHNHIITSRNPHIKLLKNKVKWNEIKLTGNHPAKRLLLSAMHHGPDSCRPQNGELEQGLVVWRGLHPGVGRTCQGKAQGECELIG